MRAVDVSPGLGIGEGELVGSDTYYFSVAGVEGLDLVDEGAALHGSHVGETGEDP